MLDVHGPVQLAAAVPAMTSGQHTEALLFSILIQLVVMIGAARLLNLVFRRFGQPGVIGEMVAGLLLGPSLFGHFWPGLSAALFGARPAPAIVILSQIGLILLMFQIGMTFEIGQLAAPKPRRALLPITAASVIVPFGLGLWLGHLSHASLAPDTPVRVYALFCGVALAITAVPVLGRILTGYGMTRHELGVLAISAAAINDIIGWLLLAAVSAVATAHFAPGRMGLQVLGVIGFALACAFILRPLARRLLRHFPVINGELPPTLMAILLIGVFLLAMGTYTLGIFAIFGGFAAGLLVHEDHAFVDAWRRQVGSFVLVFFLPVFFTFTGLRTNVLGLAGTDWAWALAFLAAATIGKVGAVAAAARLAGYNAAAAAILGALMNARGLMELIVLNVGLETGFLPQKVFTMLVIMAILTTLTTGPMLRLLMPRLGLAVPRGVEA